MPVLGDSSYICAMTYEETIDWLYGQLPMFSRVGAAAYKRPPQYPGTAGPS